MQPSNLDSGAATAVDHLDTGDNNSHLNNTNPINGPQRDIDRATAIVPEHYKLVLPPDTLVLPQYPAGGIAKFERWLVDVRTKIMQAESESAVVSITLDRNSMLLECTKRLIAIIGTTQALVEISLDGIVGSIRDDEGADSFLFLCSHLGGLPSLRKVKIVFNAMPYLAESFCPLFRSLSLRDLEISDCGLGVRGGKTILEGLIHGAKLGLKLERLVFSNSRVCQPGAEDLPSLKVDLMEEENRNRGIASRGRVPPSIVRPLADRVQHFDVSAWSEIEGIEARRLQKSTGSVLGAMLQAHAGSLQQLQVSSLGKEDYAALLEMTTYLQTHDVKFPQLVLVDINDNGMTQAHDARSTDILMDGWEEREEQGEEGPKRIFRDFRACIGMSAFLGNCPRLKIVDMGACLLDDATGMALALSFMLEGNTPGLKELRLSDNDASRTAVEIATTSIQKEFTPALRFIEVDGINLAEDTMDKGKDGDESLTAAVSALLNAVEQKKSFFLQLEADNEYGFLSRSGYIEYRYPHGREGTAIAQLASSLGGRTFTAPTLTPSLEAAVFWSPQFWDQQADAPHQEARSTEGPILAATLSLLDAEVRLCFCRELQLAGNPLWFPPGFQNSAALTSAAGFASRQYMKLENLSYVFKALQLNKRMHSVGDQPWVLSADRMGRVVKLYLVALLQHQPETGRYLLSDIFRIERFSAVQEYLKAHKKKHTKKHKKEDEDGETDADEGRSDASNIKEACKMHGNGDGDGDGDGRDE